MESSKVAHQGDPVSKYGSFAMLCGPTRRSHDWTWIDAKLAVLLALSDRVQSNSDFRARLSIILGTTS